MSEWRGSCLGDVCAYVKDRRSTEGLTLDDYISTENLLPNKGGYTTASSIPDVGQVTAFLSGDVLVSNIRPYFKKIWQATFDSGCSNDVLVFRARPGIDARWLHYVLANDAFFDHCMAGAKGCKMPRGDKQQIMEYPVSLPSLPTQRRIAAVLGALDDKIELNRKMNANLEAMAQALFKSWFVDFEPFGGQMPEGWKKGVLSDVAEFSSRRVTVSEARGDYFSTDSMRPNRQGAEASSLPEVGSVVSVDVGDVLVSNIRPYFKKIFRAVESCTCSTDVLCFKPKVKEYGLYLYRTLWSDEFFAYAVAGSKGTKMPRGDKSQMMAYEIAIPDEKKLLKFNGLVDPLCERIDANTAQSRTLAQLRDTLLPKLMSGELNVDDVKIEDDLRLSASPREHSAAAGDVSRGGAETRRGDGLI